MIKANQRIFNRLSIVLDALLAFAAMMVAYWIRFTLMPDAQETYDIRLFLVLAACNAVLHVSLFGLAGLYRTNRNQRFYNILARVLVCELICMLALLSALYVFDIQHVSRWTLFFSFAVGFVFAGGKYTAVRLLLRHYRKKGYNLKHIVIVGDGRTAANYSEMVRRRTDLGYNILGYYAPDGQWAAHEWLGGYDRLPETIKDLNPDEVVIALPPEDYPHIGGLIRACDRAGVYIHIIPCYDEYTSSKMGVETIEGINIVDIRVIPLSRVDNAIIKRCMDLAVSIVVLLVTSPIMLIAAIGTKLSSPGPILFRQERVGKDKKPFQMLKFRSMRINDKSDTAWSRSEDSRKTLFGSILRKCSIDELPQFFNILRGDMSVVGPRPEIPYYVEQFSDEVPLYMIKHYVRPGITGWAQVNGLRGDTSIKGRIEHDIYYIENWTPFFDVRIMFMTMFHLVNDEKILPARASNAKKD